MCHGGALMVSPTTRTLLMKGIMGLFFLLPVLGFWAVYALPLVLAFLSIALYFATSPSWAPKAVFQTFTLKTRRVWMALFFWSALGLVWTLDVSMTLRSMGSLGALFFLTLLLCHSIKKLDAVQSWRILSSFTWGMALALLSASLEISLDLGLYGLLGRVHCLSVYNKGLTPLVLFLPFGIYGALRCGTLRQKAFEWPGILRGITFFASLVFFALTARIFDYDAGKILLLFMAPLGVFFFFCPAQLISLGAWIVGGLSLGTPLIIRHILTVDHWKTWFPNFTDSSWVHRLHIWSYVTDRIGEKPLTGWGLNTTRHQQFQEMISWTLSPVNQPSHCGHFQTPGIPLHPHHFSLQVWMELGIVGILLFCLLFFGIAAYFRRQPKRHLERALGLTVTVNILFLAHASYGSWQSWWCASLGFCTFFILFLTHAKNHHSMTTGEEHHGQRLS